MKNTASILCLLIVLMTISSCKKSFVDPEKDDIYTITGRLYQDCNMQPVANQRMDLHQAYITTFSGLKGGFLAETTTDVNGNFKFEYKDAGGMELRIRTLFGNSFNDRMLNIPKRTNIENLIIYKDPKFSLAVNANVINSYTSGDTLFMKNFQGLNSEFILPGPFTSGDLYTTTNISLPVINYEGTTEGIRWHFRPYNGIIHNKYFPITSYCGDTIYVTVDII